MKILYGYYRPDSASISIRGEDIRICSPAEGRKHGIGMVFQNFMLVPVFTVIENVALALQVLPFVLPLASIEEQIRVLSDGDDLDGELGKQVQVPSEGIEPPAFWFEARRSIH
jgi:ABC-type uncharacterized transport system ATPase subunit